MQALKFIKAESTNRLVSLTLICASTIFLLSVLFWPTAASILSIWSTSETFTHGYFVLPVFFWLAWRQNDALTQVKIRPDLLPLVPLFGAGVLWLLSKLAGIQVGEHLAFVLILIFALWALLGRDIAGKLKFPMAFLIFLAPVGEELVPYLMEITADMTVWAIRQTNIPIYREGLFFSLPSGNWSVVEACSGIRYLISSTVLGALYAYLSFNSMRLRIGFLIISVVVPILANSMRAFMIVMLGHFSDNKIATGVDHLVYGWLFFGIVMFALFSIGGWLKKYDTENQLDKNSDTSDPALNPLTTHSEPHQLTSNSSVYTASYIRKLPTLLSIFAIIAVWPLWFAVSNLGNTSINSQTLSASALADGMIVDDSMEPLVSTASLWQPRNFGHDVRVEATYADIEMDDSTLPSVRAIAFVYQEQRQGKEMISTRNVLVSNTNDHWRLTQSVITATEPANQLEVGIESTGIHIKKSILTSATQQLAVWQWYRIGDTRTSNALVAKLVEVRNKLLLRDTVSVTYILVTDASNSAHEGALLNAMALIDSEASL